MTDWKAIMAEQTTYEPVEGRTMAGIDKLFKEKQFIEWVKNKIIR